MQQFLLTSIIVNELYTRIEPYDNYEQPVDKKPVVWLFYRETTMVIAVKMIMAGSHYCYMQWKGRLMYKDQLLKNLSSFQFDGLLRM